jgi:hypothetical protein
MKKYIGVKNSVPKIIGVKNSIYSKIVGVKK